MSLVTRFPTVDRLEVSSTRQRLGIERGEPEADRDDFTRVQIGTSLTMKRSQTMRKVPAKFARTTMNSI